jgi:hypothetical protein
MTEIRDGRRPDTVLEAPIELKVTDSPGVGIKPWRAESKRCPQRPELSGETARKTLVGGTQAGRRRLRCYNPIQSVGLWRSWERASMAWKRSRVRIPSGPPKKTPGIDCRCCNIDHCLLVIRSRVRGGEFNGHYVEGDANSFFVKPHWHCLVIEKSRHQDQVARLRLDQARIPTR